jgi:hypothetical protein
MSKSNEQKIFEDIIRWQQSGLKQKVWCEQNNFAYSSFHYWYRRFRNRQSGNKQVAGDGFVELQFQGCPPADPWCELVFGNGKKILFHQAVPVELIRSLLD